MIDVPIQVKDALRDGRRKKNYRIVVLNDDYTENFIIDNDNLVRESVSIDERLVSGDTLKFGLCEGSSIEFQYFELQNITGRQIQVFIDVDYGSDESYTIPMGFFTVSKCSRQASTGIIKAIAYNKLQSDYLDAKANDLIISIPSDNKDGTTSVYSILKHTLDNYGIVEKPKTSLPLHFSQSTAGGVGYIYPTVPCKLVGDNTTYYPSIGSRWQCRVSSGYLTGSNVITIGDIISVYSMYRILLGYTINKMYEAVFREIQNPETIWQAIINAGFVQTGITVHWWGGGVTNYTFPEICNYTTTRSIYGADTFRDVYLLEFWIPSSLSLYKNTTATGDAHYIWADTQIELTPSMFEDKVFVIDEDELSQAEQTSVDAASLPDVTLRQLQSAVYESSCQFGQLSRETDLFSGVELNHSRLFPQETLYPDNALYPDGAQSSATKSMYSKLWADEGNVHKWRNLIITYKGLDENQQEKDFVYETVINADGTDDYNCSDNWLFRNLVWTEQQIEEYADTMVSKMQDMTWFPFEMWCAGLPYVETGDEIEIPMGENSYTSYVLQRQLKGIQNLQDTYINGNLDIF